MYTKVKITGILKTLTGLHIGTGGAFSPIGSADSPVVRDVITNMPMIPGSSLKGKIRTLLSRNHMERDCKVAEDAPVIKALFGSQENRSRVLFSDLFLNEKCLQTLQDRDIYSPTEVKFENTIDRLTARANPRQIERVIRDCEFDLEIVLEAMDEEEMCAHMQLLAEGLKLLTLDYLGGNGSRGYGKVAFRELQAQCVVGELSAQTLTECDQLLKGAENA